jgi:lincosamide nucleotidyltransferase A/C/D/E
MRRTTSEAVLEALDLLVAADSDPVVAGGWGVDALVGRQTRAHADLDVAIDGRREAEALAALDAAGYRVATDWRPVRVALRRADGAEVDLHPLRYRQDGSAVQAGLDGASYEYPANGFTTGSIDGRPVRCITADLQAEFHCGYPPRDEDRSDMAALAEATGVEWRRP